MSTALGPTAPFIEGWRQEATGAGDAVNVTETGADLAQLQARFDQLRLDSRYANLVLDNTRGSLKLTYTYGDGTIGVGPDTSDPAPVWEILPSDIEVPIGADYTGTPNGLSAAVDAFRRGVKATLPGAATDGQAIHDLLWAAVQTSLRTRLVVQKSFECGESSLDRLTQSLVAVCGKMDKAVKVGDAAGPSANGMPAFMLARLAQVPGWDVTKKQFLVRFPVIRTTDARRRRYSVTVQWYWSQAWSSYLYDGDGTP